MVVRAIDFACFTPAITILDQTRDETAASGSARKIDSRIGKSHAAWKWPPIRYGMSFPYRSKLLDCSVRLSLLRLSSASVVYAIHTYVDVILLTKSSEVDH